MQNSLFIQKKLRTLAEATFSEDDKNSLVNIISKFRGIDISDDQIKGYVSDAYSTLKDMGVTKSDVKNIFEKAIEFIKGMLSRQ